MTYQKYIASSYVKKISIITIYISIFQKYIASSYVETISILKLQNFIIHRRLVHVTISLRYWPTDQSEKIEIRLRSRGLTTRSEIGCT